MLNIFLYPLVMFANSRRFLFCAVLVIMLGGCSSMCQTICLKGADIHSTPSSAIELVKQIEKRNYYRLDDGATCKANDPGRTVIKTWMNKISFDNHGMLIWGTLCNDAPESIPVLDAAGQVHIAPDLKSLIFKGDLYKFLPDPPRLCDNGIWCPK